MIFGKLSPTLLVVVFGLGAIATAFLAAADVAEWPTGTENSFRRLPPVDDTPYPCVAVGLTQEAGAASGLRPAYYAQDDSAPSGQPIFPDINPYQPVSFEQDEPESGPDHEPTVRFVMQPQPAEPSGGLPSAALAAGVATGADISLRGMSGNRRALATGVAAGVALGVEAHRRPSTDAGRFLGTSTAIVGVGMQRRNPVVTDVRTRGEHMGQLIASGSYWVPARADLDTLLNKVDSRIVQDMIVVRGPYSALHGPGFSFVDFELLPSPRFEDGFESHGSTSFDFKTNGQQWYGRQSVWAGSDNWGTRVSYGHRTGNDYSTGNVGGVGFEIPSSYNSRDFEGAIGWDPTNDRHLEFHYLRLDQTGVEFPGMVFDMRFLVTDSFGLSYVIEDQPTYDLATLDSWYNRTRFAGDTLAAGKNRQIPTLRCNLYPFDGSGDPAKVDDCIKNPSSGKGTAFTDVDAASTGYSAAFSWGQEDMPQLSLGTHFLAKTAGTCARVAASIGSSRTRKTTCPAWVTTAERS